MARSNVALATLTGLLLGACHSVERIPDRRPGETHVAPHPDRARVLAATLRVTDDGRFRFVEPMMCPTTETVDVQASTIVRVRPNLATFIVGLLAGSLGAVGTGVGWSDRDAASQPLSYAGPAAVAGGLFLAIAPFVGIGDDREDEGIRTISRDGEDAPCGERVVAATGAVLMWHGLRAVGTVDREGYFSVSPYQISDAFAAGRGPAFDLGVELALASGAHQPFQVVIAGDAMVRGRDAFLARIGVDGGREPIRKVPRVEHGDLRVVRAHVDGRAILRILLPLRNEGPGDAYQVRGLVSTHEPEVDGRVLYVGRLASHNSTIATVDVPLSPEADKAIGGKLELAVTLIDADATTSAEPARFRGAVTEPAP